MYNAYFNFPEAPFGVTPDPKFYYSNAIYQKAWITLRYGIRSRKGFIVIAGEVGTGKTTLLRKVRHAFESNIKTAYVANTLVGYNDLLRLILTDLGLPVSTDNRVAMIESLTQYLIEQFAKGNIVALLIDEAQNLSLETLEELRLLGNLETDKDKLLQIVLVGQPELEQKLDQPELRQLKQRVVLHCRLEPIATGEVGSYIDSRLQAIDRKVDDVFELAAIEKISVYSAGIPRLINIICDNALLIAAMRKHKVSADMIDEVADDLRLRRSQIKPETWKKTEKTPVEEKTSSASSTPQEVQLTDREEPPATSLAEPLAPSQIDSIPLRKDIRYSRRPIVTMSMAIVLLAGLGVSLYSHEWGISISATPSDIAARTAGERKEMNRTELAESPLEAKTPAIDAQPTLPGPRIQPLTASDQNVSPAEQYNTITAATAEDKVTVQQVSTAVMVPEVKKAERPPSGDKAEKSANKANFLVIQSSFVRASPTSSAKIIATLEPGTPINVAGRTGEYYRIRSLGTETVRGFVHKEDAFFKRKS